MDALALLCTLHADGPATLKRLRAAGCSTLARLLEIDNDDLARILGTTQAGAQRFAREAKILRRRAEFLGREEELSRVLGADDGDDDGSEAAGDDGSSPGARSHASEDEAHLVDGSRSENGSHSGDGAAELHVRGQVARDREPWAQGDPGRRSLDRDGRDPHGRALGAAPVDGRSVAEKAASDDGVNGDSIDRDRFARSLASRERREFERVLETWREHDRQESSAEASGGDTESDGGDADDEPSSRDDERAPEAALACRPGAIDGLDENLCRALANVGIDDLHGLSVIDAVDLSRRTSLAFSKLLRLRYLAAKRLAGETDTRASVRVAQPIERSVTSSPRAPVKFSVSERPYEVRAQALDLERDLLAAPRAALPLQGTARPEAAITDARARDSGRMDRAGGPFA